MRVLERRDVFLAQDLFLILCSGGCNALFLTHPPAPSLKTREGETNFGSDGIAHLMLKHQAQRRKHLEGCFQFGAL